MNKRENIKTTFLLQELRETKDIYNYFQANHDIFSEKIFSEYIKELLIKNKVPKTNIIKLTNLSKSYVYAILNGDRHPSSRNRVIAIGFAAKANFEEIQNLLIYSEFNRLSPKTQRDAAIIYAIEQNLSIQQLNELLYDLGLETIDE